MKTIAALFLFFISLQGRTNVLTENFLTTKQKSNSTAVWNFVTGSIHPTLRIDGYQTLTSPVTSADFDVGDGSDGPFNISTYAHFGTVVSQTITINTLVHPALKFSSFQLDSGYTLTAINGPLIIYSLSTVQIDGTIDCSGGDGTAATGAVGGNGGTGFCGGLSGGNGGNATASGGSGLPLSGSVSGGGGGVYAGAAPGAGGGGGGSYSGNPGVAGANSAGPPTNTGGSAGNGVGGDNPDFTILNGSPGGGGGSGSNTEGGGGGGAGGGTVVIHAVGNITISVSGFILSRGGNGGGANSGGGGGGGAGGSVKMFTPVNLHLDTGTDVDVNSGLGAVPVVANAGDGGDGSFGRTWDNSATFSGSGSESNGSSLLSLGTVEYTTAAEMVESKSYDTESTLAQFQSITSVPASPDISFEVAGSNDNFVSDDSGWQPAAALASLNKKRYVKFRMTLTNSNAAVPTQVNEVLINYDPGVKEDFQFKSGCGRINGPSSPSAGWIALLLCLMPVAVSIRLKTVGAQNKN
ncbi:MAG: hypothetical protein ACXVAX_02045 [Pseudobdellovibrio sp.]